MIYEYLENCLKSNKFYNSWLVQSDNFNKTSVDLQKFVADKLLSPTIDLSSNLDFILIKREEGASNARNITIDQIRSLQNFLYKTAGLSNNKVAIILGAEYMNTNSANCLLKVLEDTPRNSYIFLIASNISVLLPTIKSRCVLLSDLEQHQTQVSQEYDKHLTVLDTQIAWEIKSSIIKELTEKKREDWLSFANSILYFINKLAKTTSGIDISLNSLEQKIISQLPKINTAFLLAKYSLAKELSESTINLDLELKASTILLMELLHHDNYV